MPGGGEHDLPQGCIHLASRQAVLDHCDAWAVIVRRNLVVSIARMPSDDARRMFFERMVKANHTDEFILALRREVYAFLRTGETPSPQG